MTNDSQPNRPTPRDLLANRVQQAIEDDARVWGEKHYYAPSPGQTWSHVANRVTRVAVSAVEDGCFVCPRRAERDRWLLALDDILNGRGDPKDIAKAALAGKTWDTWTPTS